MFNSYLVTYRDPFTKTVKTWQCFAQDAWHARYRLRARFRNQFPKADTPVKILKTEAATEQPC